MSNLMSALLGIVCFIFVWKICNLQGALNSFGFKIHNIKSTKTICIDFDGVLHRAPNWFFSDANGPQIGESIAWLKSLLMRNPYGDLSNFDICIFSTRNGCWGGRWAMKRWLLKEGLTKHELSKLRFPIYKPPASLFIDDKAINFGGKEDFNTLTPTGIKLVVSYYMEVLPNAK